ARAWLQRRRRLGHRRHHRAVRAVEPDGQRDLAAPERRVLPDGPRAAREALNRRPDPMAARFTIVIPVLDQRPSTRQCVDALIAGGCPPDSILVIDNGSSDDTPQWLATRPEI